MPPRLEKNIHIEKLVHSYWTTNYSTKNIHIENKMTSNLKMTLKTNELNVCVEGYPRQLNFTWTFEVLFSVVIFSRHCVMSHFVLSDTFCNTWRTYWHLNFVTLFNTDTLCNSWKTCNKFLLHFVRNFDKSFLRHFVIAVLL